MDAQEQYEQKKSSLDGCLARIENGDTIAVSGVITEPVSFLGSLSKIIPRLRDVTVVKSKDNEYDYLRDPATRGHVETIGHFYGPAFRAGHRLGITSYIPSDCTTICPSACATGRTTSLWRRWPIWRTAASRSPTARCSSARPMNARTRSFSRSIRAFAACAAVWTFPSSGSRPFSFRTRPFSPSSARSRRRWRKRSAAMWPT